MKKLTILAAILLLSVPAAFAQQRMGAFSGQVTDNASAEYVTGAVIEMRSQADSTFVKHEVSGLEGKFSLANLPYGQYTMRVTFLGYEPAVRTITINARNINIGHIFMTQVATDLEAANIMAQAVRVSQNGDTITYNAHAFKVSEDADADELLRQLPGVEVGQDGTVKAQGKDVQKIFVDGKETFGTDVATTMRNIPANVIDKVEVYNKLSDFAETTGINDGDDYQVMNFVTGVTFAQFGTFTALYGIEDKYGLDARYNLVTGNHGIMLNASANNTGGMSGGGMMMGMGMMGEGGYHGRFGGGGNMSENNKSKTYNTALNYNYGASEKLRVNFNYRYGHRDNERKNESDRTYFEAVGNDYNRATELTNNNSRSNRHNFGGSMNWRISKMHSINLRMEGSYSNDHDGLLNETDQFMDAIANRFRYERNQQKGRSESYDFRLGLNYGIKFEKPGRSLSFGLNAGKEKEDGNENIDTRTIIPGETPPLDSLGRRRSVDNSGGWNVRTRVQYSEPISTYWRLMAVYDFSYRFSDRNNGTFMWDYDYPSEAFDTGVFVPWGQRSNVMERSDISHRFGPGIYYTKNSNMLRFDLVYKYTAQELIRTLPEPSLNDKINFNNFIYDAIYHMQLTPQERLEFQLSADTNNPSIDQLQDVDRVSANSLYVSTGNPNLKPYYSHNGSISYNTNNIVRATHFSITVNGAVTTNYIGTRTEFVTTTTGTLTTPNGTKIEPGGQWSRPVNMGKSSWTFGGHTSYSMPLNFIKSNFSMNGRYDYNESPGYINNDENTARTHGFSAGTNLSSNWSTDLTMHLNYSFSPSFTRNTNKTYDRSSTIGNRLSYNFSWNTWLDFVLRGNLSYTNNLTRQKGVDDYRFENTACNLSLGKRIFRNKRGEVTFSVNDLFDQNAYSSQSVYPNYIENEVDRGIGRYFSISFSYRLRDFYKNGQSMSRIGGGRRGGRRGGFETLR